MRDNGVTDRSFRSIESNLHGQPPLAGVWEELDVSTGGFVDTDSHVCDHPDDLWQSPWAVDPCGLPRVGIGIYPGDFFGARSRLSGRPRVQQLQRPTRATYRPGQRLQRGFHSEPCRVQSVRAGHKLLLERFGRFEAGAQLDLLSSKSRRVIATRSGYGGNYRLRHPTILLPRGSHRCSALRHRSTVAADRLLQVPRR